MRAYVLQQLNTTPPLYLTDHGAWSIPTVMIKLFHSREAAEREQREQAPLKCEPVAASLLIRGGTVEGAVDAIIMDILSRSGIGGVFSAMSGGVKREIQDEWARIIRRKLHIPEDEHAQPQNQQEHQS